MKPTVVPTELFTTQASEDAKKAQEEVSVPDPTEEEGQAAIAANTLKSFDPAI